ncbi:MAG TPA: glycoside hydrolase family 92 protein, partial [Pseudoxanthomonas sp.]|nr:glycoside hydrolase family 92 protein [Pseudoxanthomonas sp.]
MTFFRCYVPRPDLGRSRRLQPRFFALLLLTAINISAVASPQFSTSFEANDPESESSASEQLQVAAGVGPEAPYAAKAEMGYSGLRALRYQATGSGGRMQLFPVDIPVQSDTTLSWMVLPEIVDGNVLASVGVSLDLVFDDGRRLSTLSARDQH